MTPAPTLSPAARRDLKARAHHLAPVASIGSNGLTDGVLKEIDAALIAHELIKVRVHGDDRVQRKAWGEEICSKLGAVSVQEIGKLLVLWRERPPEVPKPAAPSKPKTSVATLKSAKAFAEAARRRALAAAKNSSRPRARPGKPGDNKPGGARSPMGTSRPAAGRTGKAPIRRSGSR